MPTEQDRIRDELRPAEHAGSLLQRPWAVSLCPDSNGFPDCEIVDGGAKFALEVRSVNQGEWDCSTDPPSRQTQSLVRKGERIRERKISDIRLACAQRGVTNLNVQIWGSRTHYPHNRYSFDSLPYEGVVDRICALGVHLLPKGSVAETELGGGSSARVLHGSRDFWKFVPDCAGFVDTEALCVQLAVSEKARNIAAYRQNSGLDDIRLLLVADRGRASGLIDPPPSVDRAGFTVVYFYDGQSVREL